MIIICPNCSQKNRVPDQPRTDGIYRCGRSICQTLLLGRKVEFHDRLIRDVTRELGEIKEELNSIKLAIFRQRDIYFLRTKYERNQARIQNWFDHVEYIKDKQERKAIYSSYRHEIGQIKKEINDISDILTKKETIKQLLQKFAPLRHVFGILGGGLKLAAGVLAILGIELGRYLQFALEDMEIFLIEGGLEDY